MNIWTYLFIKIHNSKSVMQILYILFNFGVQLRETVSFCSGVGIVTTGVGIVTTK